jgi:tetratricopeptide (TPR) repeat protein
MALMDRIKKRQKPSAGKKGASGKAGTSPAHASLQIGDLERAFQKAFTAERWADALKHLQAWIELDSENLSLHRKHGDLLLKMGEKKEALQKYWGVVQGLCDAGYYRQARALNQLILRIAPNLEQVQKKSMEIEAKLGFFSHPLFAEMSDEEFGDVVNKTKFRRFPKENIVIKEGEAGRSLFMIYSGKVDVYVKDAQKGIAEKVARLGKDNFFGEGGFLTGRPRSATILTIEDSILLELSKEDLDDVVKKHTRIGQLIQRYHEKRLNP